ncbi:DNA-3-methyladenine glycosylase [Achromobacter piechaudii]|uniref:DNA-3-methyladenine glycosylase n=1 Tax=Achromobacter piechaudii TaxID=72556 RepID=UPI0020C63DC1|nr:DNA-3-methyladenine glycosylase [Achromobacter piechaudii]
MKKRPGVGRLTNLRHADCCIPLVVGQQGTGMLEDELLVKMIVRTAPIGKFDDWAEVLAEYAKCVALISPKINQEECDRLLTVGASFYRTLARAENYRRTSARSD